ncbi:hypothetical protein ABB37_05571 [Leptomonas pyrrhocoris]|uniref:Uncharacterized protein n=1 Tax=Leptomonas pyrrhocoris TaxID=157538 RepID=A0A0M9FZ24_LEPPY|nr:hypothetical protein ABB37_05571 [Leptomonas pyrrhocoris]KPA79035.1 hypothetical protein ABB37_05571 [Leptomonas pyrrhocoris]|eukprot:XP_015657474.1 hypothetical protein ABB37_05571 [Leptomonas pyrrhocoris]
MDAYIQGLWLRLRDVAQRSRAAALPSDRPSALFAVFTSVFNGGLLVWSFSEVLGRTCSKNATIWISLGMAHCYVNMIFAVTSMMHIRRRIACGIPAEASQASVLYRSPLMLFYAFYLVCELVWVIAAAQLSVRDTGTECVRHITVQILFLVMYWLLGMLVLFQLTFITERWRRPRWRNFAAMRWDYLHNTQRHRNVRWHDEHIADGGDEPADLDNVELQRGADTERTSTMDYASMRDDMTVENDYTRETATVQRPRSTAQR